MAFSTRLLLGLFILELTSTAHICVLGSQIACDNENCCNRCCDLINNDTLIKLDFFLSDVCKLGCAQPKDRQCSNDGRSENKSLSCQIGAHLRHRGSEPQPELKESINEDICCTVEDTNILSDALQTGDVSLDCFTFAPSTGTPTIAPSTNESTATNVTGDNSKADEEDKSGESNGISLAVIAAPICVLVLLGFLAALIVRRKKQDKRKSGEQSSLSEDNDTDSQVYVPPSSSYLRNIFNRHDSANMGNQSLNRVTSTLSASSRLTTASGRSTSSRMTAVVVDQTRNADTEEQEIRDGPLQPSRLVKSNARGSRLTNYSISSMFSFATHRSSENILDPEVDEKEVNKLI